MADERRARYVGDMSEPASPAVIAEPALLATIGQEMDWAEAAEARMLSAASRMVAEGAGWNDALVLGAAKATGLSAADAELLTPNGARDLVALLWRRHDRMALEALARLDPTTMKVRERIRAGVLARINVAMADEADVRASCPHRPGYGLRAAEGQAADA